MSNNTGSQYNSMPCSALIFFDSSLTYTSCTYAAYLLLHHLTPLFSCFVLHLAGTGWIQLNI